MELAPLRDSPTLETSAGEQLHSLLALDYERRGNAVALDEIDSLVSALGSSRCANVAPS
jgi:hypothetical protein